MPKVYHEENFDDFKSIISGYRKKKRLTIFKMIEEVSANYTRGHIIYQADCEGIGCLKKLKNQIGEFRYGFTTNEYDLL